jgi:hypothetical protein
MHGVVQTRGGGPCLCCAYPTQVAIALQGGDIIYFELDQLGQLLETEKKEVREWVIHLCACLQCTLGVLGQCKLRPKPAYVACREPADVCMYAEDSLQLTQCNCFLHVCRWAMMSPAWT